MTRNQKAIINFAMQNDGITKKQAVELLDQYYFRNGLLHLDTISHNWCMTASADA